METQEAILKIDTFTLGHLTKLMQQGDPKRRKSNLFDEEAVFGDGTRMAIQVCPGEDGEGNSAPWTQGVLYTDSGEEVGCSEPGEELLGSYRVEDEDHCTAYVCHVMPDEDIWHSTQTVEVKTVVYPLAQKDEALSSVDTREGWNARRMGPRLIGAGQYSARLGEIVFERDVGPPH